MSPNVSAASAAITKAANIVRAPTIGEPQGIALNMGLCRNNENSQGYMQKVIVAFWYSLRYLNGSNKGINLVNPDRISGKSSNCNAKR